MPPPNPQDPLQALGEQTEALLRELERCDPPQAERDRAHELLLDGCAHALRLDLARMHLERDISRLASVGGPADADELHRLSASLTTVTGMAEDLRGEIARVRSSLDD